MKNKKKNLKNKEEKEENIINKNENIMKLKIDEENKSDSNDKKNNNLFDNAFRRSKKVIEYGYEESEEQDEINNNDKMTENIEESNKNNINDINEMKEEINCELELDNLKSKYLTMNNANEKTLLNRKTKSEHEIQNIEDINPNILNTNIQQNEEIMIKNKDKNQQINLREEHISIKNSVKNFANEIDNFKFDDYISDFNNDKIKETQKQLDNNENTKIINEDMICCVCYEIFSNKPDLNYSLSKCNHMLCNICWSKTLYEKLECPICRKKVRVKTLKRLIKGELNITDNNTTNGK